MLSFVFSRFYKLRVWLSQLPGRDGRPIPINSSPNSLSSLENLSLNKYIKNIPISSELSPSVAIIGWLMGDKQQTSCWEVQGLVLFWIGLAVSCCSLLTSHQLFLPPVGIGSSKITEQSRVSTPCPARQLYLASRMWFFSFLVASTWLYTQQTTGSDFSGDGGNLLNV